MPKDAWDTLSKLYSRNMQASKNNVQRENTNINDYSMIVKKLADSLASIGAPIKDDDLVFVTLNGIGKEYYQSQIFIGVHETFPNF